MVAENRELSVFSEVVPTFRALSDIQQKIPHFFLRSSNFFVFQYFLIKISVRSELIVKRTNPGFFMKHPRKRTIRVPRIENMFPDWQLFSIMGGHTFSSTFFDYGYPYDPFARMFLPKTPDSWFSRLVLIALKFL